MEYERKILEHFLRLPLNDAEAVLSEFNQLYGAKYYPSTSKEYADSFVYVPGARNDRVLLVAHSDTVFDWHEGTTEFVIEEDTYFSANKDKNVGIGADDRAGCAILWLLRDMGHSLLITNGEEYGSIAAGRIATELPSLYDELNAHSYIIEFDRRHATDYKTYHIPVSDEFIAFIEGSTGYTDAGKNSSTDITCLCGEICGVNLSVGYYYEHTPDECLVFAEWMNTFNVARNMLEGVQERFPLRQE